MDASPAVEQRVRERTDRLERFYDRIVDCHVMVMAPHRSQQQGRLYQVHIRIAVPGEDVVISHERPQDPAHADVYVALRDAFEAAERRLEDYARRREQHVKTHDVPQHGRVVRLFPQDGYGFVETADGIETYFHENALVDGRFADLELGDEVRVELAEQESDKGPQATTVRPVGKHHLIG